MNTLKPHTRKQPRFARVLDYLQNQQHKDDHRIALPSSKETRFIKIIEITRCASSNNYTTFYTLNGESVLTSKPIFEYEQLLQGYGFIRCHQSHLVNKRYIKSWVKQDGGYLVLEDGTHIPVSRQKKDLVKKQLE
jgi:two-component system LytT family response regulator